MLKLIPTILFTMGVTNQDNSLHRWARWNDGEMVTKRMFKGENPFKPDARGNTAFHHASAAPEAMQALLHPTYKKEWEKAMRTKNKDGDTPWDLANPETKEIIEERMIPAGFCPRNEYTSN